MIAGVNRAVAIDRELLIRGDAHVLAEIVGVAICLRGVEPPRVFGSGSG